MIKSGYNPQQLLMSVLESQAGTPMGANLLSLVQNGQGSEIEKIVRNLYAQSGGKDFDKDFLAFKKMLGY